MSAKKNNRVARGHKRRIAGLVLIVLGVLVAGAWAWSGWGAAWIAWEGQRTLANEQVFYAVECSKGQLALKSQTIGEDDMGGRATLRVGSRWGISIVRPSAVWEYRAYGRSAEQWRNQFTVSTRVSLLPVLLLVVTGGALLVRSGVVAARRRKGESCAVCGYSRAGLGEGAACPECGRADR